MRACNVCFDAADAVSTHLTLLDYFHGTAAAQNHYLTRPPGNPFLPRARKRSPTNSNSQFSQERKGSIPLTTTMLASPNLTLLAALALLAVLLAAPLTPRDRDPKFPMLDFWGYCLPCYKLCPAHNRGCTFSACIVKGVSNI
jgi:hypothetical protein